MYASLANTGVEQAGQRGVGGAAVQGMVQGRLNSIWAAWAFKWSVMYFCLFVLFSDKAISQELQEYICVTQKPLAIQTEAASSPVN